MDERARIIRILKILLEEYPDRRPPLKYGTPFQFLIAVILSAQTTDAGVNRITPELFSLYPDPQSLAGASLATLQKIIRPLGFFVVKSKNIRKTARLIAEEHGGEIPDSMEDLLALPGVGRKTASVIRANIFALPGIIVDTHFSRVILRLGFTDTRDPLKVERAIAKLVFEEYWSDLSMAINFHGRKYCTARKPFCESCPVRKECLFFRSKR